MPFPTAVSTYAAAGAAVVADVDINAVVVDNNATAGAKCKQWFYTPLFWNFSLFELCLFSLFRFVCAFFFLSFFLLLILHPIISSNFQVMVTPQTLLYTGMTEMFVYKHKHNDIGFEPFELQ